MKNIFSSITIILLIITMSACSDKSKNTGATVTVASTTSQTSASGQYATPPAFVEHPDTAKIEYPDVTIYYDDGKYIYSYNPKTQVKKQLTSGWEIHLSHKKDRFAFQFGKSEPEFASTSRAEGFYTYTIATGEEKLVSAAAAGEPIYFQEWSPNDSYIVIDSGTSNLRGQDILDSITGQDVINLLVPDGVTWYSSHELIFTEIQKVNQKGQRPVEIPGAFGVVLIDINTKAKTDLKHATPFDNYSFIKIINKDEIVIASTSIPHDKEWGNTDDEVTIYLVIDKAGKVLREMKDFEYENLELTKKIKQIQDSLPSPYNTYKLYPYGLAEKGNWVVFQLYSNYKYPEFFIMDKTNPRSLRKIGDGVSIVW